MDLYFLIILILVLLMIFYGGHNKLKRIEYNTNFFCNIHKIIQFEKKIQINIKNNLNIPFEDLTNKINIHVIPNLLHIYYVDIKPYSSFTINNINLERNIMIIFNHSNDKIYLILQKINNDSYLYKIDKKISVLSIYPIYNNNNKIIPITIFILKKPYWYY